jgi:hypothetical protein
MPDDAPPPDVYALARRALAAGNDGPASTVILRSAADLTPEPVRWLWPGWLAAGKLHIVAGSPGTGKTTLAMAVAATLTIGGRWPDGSPAQTGAVAIWSGEDDPADTLLPRLLAAGADPARVHFVAAVQDANGTRPFAPADDMPALSEALSALPDPPALLIVDPVVSAVAGDSHKNAEVRRALQPLVDLAQRHRCAVLGISHFSKGTAGRDPVDRVTGSLGFGALARVVMATAKRSDEDGGGRMLARAKSNLGPDGGGYVYDLEPCEPVPGIVTTRVVWGDALDGTARELLASAETIADDDERSAMDEARDFLLTELAAGPMAAKDVYKAARECGIAERTLKRAKSALGIVAEKAAFRAGWRWALPAKETTKEPITDSWPPSVPVAPLVHGHGPEGGQTPPRGPSSEVGTLAAPLAPLAHFERAEIEAWLDRIGETDPTERADYLRRADADPAAASAALALARGTP